MSCGAIAARRLRLMRRPQRWIALREHAVVAPHAAREAARLRGARRCPGVRVRDETPGRVAYRGLPSTSSQRPSRAFSGLKNNSGRDESVTARGLSPARTQSGSHCLRVRTITQQPHRLRVIRARRGGSAVASSVP